MYSGICLRCGRVVHGRAREPAQPGETREAQDTFLGRHTPHLFLIVGTRGSKHLCGGTTISLLPDCLVRVKPSGKFCRTREERT
jgi:hypothetical protein